MSRAEYYYVFESIFFALVIAELLVGWNKMIVSRKTIKLYWAHLCFSILYLLMIVTSYSWEFYTSSFDLINSPFTFFLFVCLKPAAYFFGAYQAFPKSTDDVDFKEFFKARRREILIPAGILQLFTAFKTCSHIVASKGMDHFLSTYFVSTQALGEVYLQVFFVPVIFFAAFHKKLWSAEMLAILGLLGQIYYLFVEFR